MNANPDQVMAAVIIFIAAAALVAWAFTANFGPSSSAPAEQTPGDGSMGVPAFSPSAKARFSAFKEELRKIDAESLEDRHRDGRQTQAFLRLGEGLSFSREQVQTIRAECERQRSWPDEICAWLQGFSHVMFDCEFRPTTATINGKTETQFIIREYHYET